MTPYLREKIPTGFNDIPQATVYEAGYLVSKNAGWRNIRPVVSTEKCKGCLQCYLYCPDGVISKDSSNGKVKVFTTFARAAVSVQKSVSLKQFQLKQKNRIKR